MHTINLRQKSEKKRGPFLKTGLPPCQIVSGSMLPVHKPVAKPMLVEVVIQATWFNRMLLRTT